MRLQPVIAVLAILSVICLDAPAGAASESDLLDELWRGKAHFVEVSNIRLDRAPYFSPHELDAWVTVESGRWFLFSREPATSPAQGCKYDHTRVVVRESDDQSKTWSNPAAVAVEPGNSLAGDGCAVLDGSSVYDAASDTWHMIVQCLDKANAGGWGLCHYTRKGPSPLGHFEADSRNPVVMGNSLWSQICSGKGRACNPEHTRDEGTPDIVDRRDGFYEMTLHGFDYQANRSYRGVVRTRDFHTWLVTGGGLPGAPIFGPSSCQSWVKDCTGVGESSSLFANGRQYVLIEAMNKSLLCTPGQDWVFSLLRAPAGEWPRIGSDGWQEFPGNPLLRPTWPGPKSRCGLQYARWIHDGSDIFILYEDWGPDFKFVDRRLLKLISAAKGTPPVLLKSESPAKIVE
jgi:hypothetical protein